jgi:hypothetical protein
LTNANKERWRKRPNSLIGPYDGFGVTAPIVVREGKSQHCSVVQRIARAQAHSEFKVGDGGIGLATPSSHEPTRAQRIATVRIQPDSALQQLKAGVEVKSDPEESETDNAECEGIVRAQLFQPLGETQKLDLVFIKVSGPSVAPSPGNATRSATIGPAQSPDPALWRFRNALEHHRWWPRWSESRRVAGRGNRL